MSTENGEKNRRKILEVISANPGVCKTELCQFTGFAWGTIGYHVHVMLNRSQIQTRRTGQKLIFAHVSLTNEEVAVGKALRNKWSPRVLGLLKVEGPAGTSKISQTLNVSRKTIAGTLRVLRDANLVFDDGKYHLKFGLTEYGLRAFNEFGLSKAN